MFRILFLTFLCLTSSGANALNWNEENLDWQGWQSVRYGDADPADGSDIMAVSMRDSDAYGLYYIDFACAYAPTPIPMITMSLVVPWRNPYSGTPKHVEFVIRFELDGGETQTQNIQMIKDPMGDDHTSWDGEFPTTLAFLDGLGRARSMSILTLDGEVVKTFRTRGGAVAGAALTVYCTEIPYE